MSVMVKDDNHKCSSVNKSTPSLDTPHTQCVCIQQQQQQPYVVVGSPCPSGSIGVYTLYKLFNRFLFVLSVPGLGKMTSTVAHN